MKNLRKNLLTLLLCKLLLISCSSEEPKNDQFYARTVLPGVDVNFDLSEIEGVDKDLKQLFGEKVSWSLRLQNPQKSTILEFYDMSFANLKEDLTGRQIEEVSYLLSEILAKSISGDLLAANGNHFITRVHGEQTWNEKCPYSQNNISNFDKSSVPAVIKIQVCNLSKPYSTDPSDSPNEANTLEHLSTKNPGEVKTIAYKCKFNKVYGNSDDVISSSGPSLCIYGYDPQAGEASPILEVPTAYATGTPLYLSSILNFERFIFRIGKAGQISVSTTFSDLPFGSMQSCHSLKFDVNTASGSTTKAHRLDFFRSGIKGADTWTIKENESTPTMRDLVRYYSDSNDSLTAYLVCSWIPSSPSLPITRI